MGKPKPDECPYDGKPCFVASRMDAHFRCGTSACDRSKGLLDAARSEGQPPRYDGGKSLGERLYESFPTRVPGALPPIPWMKRPPAYRAFHEKAAVTFTASLSGGEGEGS